MSAQRSQPFRAGALSASGEAWLPEIDMDALVTASQGALYTGKTVAAVCNWVARHILEPATDRHGGVRRNSRGCVLYRLGDVLEAEATDKRTTTGRKRAA
jgi:hypothetical protein